MAGSGNFFSYARRLSFTYNCTNFTKQADTQGIRHIINNLINQLMNKQNKIQLTVREFIHYINAMGQDVDVQVDGVDYIAVVGGNIALTPKGMEKFGPVLDMKMDGFCIVGSDEDYNKLDIYNETDALDGGNLMLAWDFLRSLAGYCPASLFDEWFEGPTAQLI